MSGNSADGTNGDLAFVMGGGGARAAYQAGVLRYLSRRFPSVQAPIITGVSAGAINAAHLAAHHGTFEQATEELYHMWSNLNVDHVFRTDVGSLSWHVMRWARQLVSGGTKSAPRVRGLLDTEPLRVYLTDAMHAIDGELTGINYNLRTGRLKAVALSTTNYSTGQSVLWVQGQGVKEWERPTRRSRLTTLTVEHVLASSALPIVFPAVKIGAHWFGDGGIRLAAPLSPALHLGAGRILAISTRHSPTARQASRPTITGYPPPVQVAGVMMNSVFLDLLDDDAHRLETINRLLAGLPPEARGGMRPVRLLTVRPSVHPARPPPKDQAPGRRRAPPRQQVRAPAAEGVPFPDAGSGDQANRGAGLSEHDHVPARLSGRADRGGRAGRRDPRIGARRPSGTGGNNRDFRGSGR